MSTLFTRLCAGLLVLPLAATAQNTASPALIEVKTTDATPLTRLRLQTTGGLFLGGTYNTNDTGGDVPAENEGTRLMWHPERAAFRAGYVSGTQWNDANIGNYSVALGQNCRASGNSSFATGNSSTAAQTSSVALGQYCTASGTASVALGNDAHTNARQGSFVFSDNSLVHDSNSGADANSFRAANNNSANWRVAGGFRIYTSSDKTKGIIFHDGATSTTSGSYTPSWFNYQYVISTHTGAYLSNGGTWTNASDRRKKHRFEAVAGEDVLRRLRQVPITRWSYRADPATVRHLGPMAQDFRRAFGLGADSISIGTVDADGVALAGVQALDARTQGQQAELAALRRDNAELHARLAALEHAPAAPATAGLAAPAAGLLAALSLGVGLLAAGRWPRRPRPAALAGRAWPGGPEACGAGPAGPSENSGYLSGFRRY
ncbi:Chaperone of endosialidase [Hymenobacter daecheongensis DSM 21074]|uniref:Chaperone of endosialidase n=1 Tax=Hymenobacter daecheongensis DSM 21074 TaxID=1121955 RepID=A0A1M6A8Y4_9BACT|nr:tail fiber domain-containing protein [Hymenobacter daecheongensis]SHI32920.1 Chaperone of endosialidase [Hymenobacter daecheongensis DSM 21074]